MRNFGAMSFAFKNNDLRVAVISSLPEAAVDCTGRRFFGRWARLRNCNWKGFR